MRAHIAQDSNSLVTWSTVRPNCRASAAIVAAETSTYLPQRRPVGVERHRRRKAVAGVGRTHRRHTGIVNSFGILRRSRLQCQMIRNVSCGLSSCCFHLA